MFSLTRSNVDNNHEGYKEREDRTAERDREEKRAGQGRAELTMSVKRNRAERSSVEQRRSKVEQRGRAKNHVASRYRVERIGDEINDDKRPTVFRSTYVFIYSYWYNS